MKRNSLRKIHLPSNVYIYSGLKLVCYLEVHRREYAHFILTGES